MFRTYEPPELILPISYGDLGGAGRVAPPAQEVDRGGLTEGLEHPCAVRVGLVIPALSFVACCSSGTFAAAI